MPIELFHQRRVVVWWFLNTASLCEIWWVFLVSCSFWLNVSRFSRMSLAYTFYRLLPNGKARIISIVLTIAFMLGWIPTFAWRLRFCLRNTSWANKPRGTCDSGTVLDVFEIISASYLLFKLWFVTLLSLQVDAFSCVCLMVLAAHVLWQMDLPSKKRRIITFVLTGSLFSATAVIFHSLFTITGNGSYQSYTAQIEVRISWIVAIVYWCMPRVHSPSLHVTYWPYWLECIIWPLEAVITITLSNPNYRPLRMAPKSLCLNNSCTSPSPNLASINLAISNLSRIARVSHYHSPKSQLLVEVLVNKGDLVATLILFQIAVHGGLQKRVWGMIITTANKSLIIERTLNLAVEVPLLSWIRQTRKVTELRVSRLLVAHMRLIPRQSNCHRKVRYSGQHKGDLFFLKSPTNWKLTCFIRYHSLGLNNSLILPVSV